MRGILYRTNLMYLSWFYIHKVTLNYPILYQHTPPGHVTIRGLKQQLLNPTIGV